MECPHCGHTFILGDDLCEHCNADLTHIHLPKPKSGRIHEMILEDPISQLNAPEPLLVQVDDTVDKAFRRMKKMRFGSVLVVKDGKLAGIFTEHDLLKHFGGRETRLSQVKISDVMTPDPHYLNEDDTLAHALNSMAVGGYRHIPVVEDEKPKALVSVRGILQYLAENAL